MCHAKTLSFILRETERDLGLTQRSDVCRITSYKDQTAEVWKRIGRAGLTLEVRGPHGGLR